ncbi:MAG: hypothetical protein JRJ77_19450 [Deltaproteobacteria bacterium]|nr:hypothetical protein [Deltaproteobacteria bacterium]
MNKEREFINKTFDKFEKHYGPLPLWPNKNGFMFYVWYIFCGGWTT